MMMYVCLHVDEELGTDGKRIIEKPLVYINMDFFHFKKFH